MSGKNENTDIQEALRNQRINQIVDVLQDPYLGQDAYRSTGQPFFMKGPSLNFVKILNVSDTPDPLNRNFHYIYKIVGNPTTEVSFTKQT